ncbi:MAG: pyruvate carboxylase [Phycisphaerales bacterium]|nr:pyruvate carboxylase [Phycisphaerales bacterium]
MKKLLVANRSEIAIRVFRAATELGLTTVAVYTYEDRFALHRFKADESYQIGPEHGGEPVRGYLNIDGIIRVAKEHHVDAIHPGYGFLAESAELARACAKAGIIFIGPSAEMLDMFGDKTAAKQLAKKAGVPTIGGTDEALSDPKKISQEAQRIGFPIMVKASFGGGGRGMRIVHNAEELLPRVEEASREAAGAFGRSEVFLERYISRAKHIEVQILGDRHGNLVHLWERDCSVQRRHQKVVEIAPSVNLPKQLRHDICQAAVRLCSSVNFFAAGTVEFLVDLDRHEFFFIEVNPRIQVEHTVTEVVTGIDLVKSQILVCQNHALHSAPMNVPVQDKIETRGYAIQSRITTEDPENNFIPDYGRITTYRSAAGFGVRLDGGTAFGGAVITPYFDSLLVKLTASGGTFIEAIRRMDRALREFRVRGVKTNIPFLENLIHHHTFQSGDATTTFIDTAKELFEFVPRKDRATRLLGYLGDVILNGRADVKARIDPKREFNDPPMPTWPHDQAPPDGTRQRLQAMGATAFANWIKKQKGLLLTDTSMRDAHQSLLATRMRSFDLLKIAPAYARLASGLFSIECWGGATFDASMRFLQEDPWDRLRQLRQRVPNVLLQMLLRSSNAVGYTNYPDNVVRQFTIQAAREGIDVFRIFDSLNSIEAMKLSIQTVREKTDSLCEASICYSGDILDPKRTKYSLKYYIKLARELEKMGTHILGIKDMAGLCKPLAAYELVKALKQEVDLPIHFHTHDTSGINAGSVLRAAEAGVDIADAALSSMSGLTSQPNLNAIVAALANTRHDTGLDFANLGLLSDYFETARNYYYPFEEDLKSPAAEVYHHEMPGGQYTNLRQQAKSLGLGDRWHEIADTYAEVNMLFGDIVKVTPSSKVVGDMALFMVTNGLSGRDVLDPTRKLTFPKSVVEMMQGMIGWPPGGFPKVFQKIVLNSAGVKPIKGRAGAKLPKIDFKAAAKELAAKIHRTPSDTDLLSYLLYSQVFLDFEKHRQQYGDTSVIPTPNFFYGAKVGEEVNVEIEEGKTLVVKFLTIGEPHPDGTRTLFFELNGQPREILIADLARAGDVHRKPKADLDDPDHVAAPMPGKISNVAVKKGERVKEGQHLLSIEAMKMETAVYAPRNSTVKELKIKQGDVVETQDLLVVLEG